MQDLAELEQALGHVFQDRALLVRALTHSSSVNDSVSAGSDPVRDPIQERIQDNERLEFLGDSILGWLVSELLFRRFPDFTEGQLSLVKNHVVSAAHLVSAALKLDLGRYLQLGRGEESTGGRGKQRLLVNALEAVLAAVYLDSGPAAGPEAVREVLLRYNVPDDEELRRLAGSRPPEDYRAELERITRDRALPKPQYLLVSEGGPGHAKIYKVEVRVGKDVAGTGEGSSKKTAAHHAARELCRKLISPDISGQ